MMKKVFRKSVLGLALVLGGLSTATYAGTGNLSIFNGVASNQQIKVTAWNDKNVNDGTAYVQYDQTVGPYQWFNYYPITSTYDTLRVYYQDDSGLWRQCGTDIPPGPDTIPVVGSDYRTYEITQCDSKGILWNIMPHLS